MKVNGEYVGRTLVTLCVAATLVAFIHDYQHLPKSAEHWYLPVYGVFLISLLLIPLVWVRRLRANKPLNAAVFLSGWAFIAMSAWQANGNKPVSYVFGFLWVGMASSYILGFPDWNRKRKAHEADASQIDG
jgi:hypothetical protein